MSELISNVRIFPVNHDRLLANASFTVAGAFAIKVKVTRSDKGLMVSMPSQSYQKDGETRWSDLAFPVTREARSEMIEKVIEAYKQEVGNNNESNKETKRKGDKVPF
jgi:DNA-binding cell septation regulator SpoVG